MRKRRPTRIGLSAGGAGEELTIINARFVADLPGRGYSPATIQTYGRVAEQFRCWWLAHPEEGRKLREDSVTRFVRAYGAKCRRQQWPTYRVAICRRALRRWLVFLRQQGLMESASISCGTAREQLLQAYDRHLAEVRGLAVGTRKNHQVQSLDFLTWLAQQPPRLLKRLGPKEVQAYVADCAHRFSLPVTRNMASGLRSFLRYLAWRKICRPFLDQAVPPVAPWPRGEVRCGVTESEYRRFLTNFERTTRLGRRNYALALCLGELGLRASEAAAIGLADLDWRRQVLRLPQTKQRRERLLPLPPRVARALWQYLQRARPLSFSPVLFVRHRPPLDCGLSPSQVGFAMSRAFARTGLSVRGAHVLRYSLATRLQQRGVGLKAIADLLGHQSLESTARYVRVDFRRLREAALPWPETLP